ncbi:hypothetical protein OsJ_19842 [Oryza sativa Japonica Group]|uniref:Uncharacterized protein n=1 Tax=Oryza sativa subsp. japonica TaxID=39947 RepID=B9FR44_ORYSJ|nr:hypothetical protein OsJ_19842 [Oryza sativa Japonica Group]
MADELAEAISGGGRCPVGHGGGACDAEARPGSGGGSRRGKGRLGRARGEGEEAGHGRQQRSCRCGRDHRAWFSLSSIRFTPYVHSFFVDTCTVLQQRPADADLTTAAANGGCAFCPPGRVLHPTEFYCGKQQHKDELDLSLQKLKLLS